MHESARKFANLSVFWLLRTRGTINTMIQPPMQSPGAKLREMFKSGIVVMPGVYDALSAKVAHNAGARALYVSGGATTNAMLGSPDIALISLEEMSGTAARCCQVAPVPIISDADTGFGEVWNVVRTVIEMERAGLAGIHLEDQVSPKRCGHLDGKEVVSTEHMATKIRAAVSAKRDPSFMIIARTDARGIEGLDQAIERAKAYLDAGADAIFPEGLTSKEEFAAFRQAISAPLLANMTEFGKTPIISAQEFEELGYQMVIFPVTALRCILATLEDFYADLLVSGSQADWLPKMRTRQQLYEAIDYAKFTAQDEAWSQSK